MGLVCNVCGGTEFTKARARGDGRRVLFCSDCDMGVVENPPRSVTAYYRDGYYGHASAADLGYLDYAFTAEHSLLWVRLLIEALVPAGGRILDVGCADGFLLRSLSGPYERCGIEANPAAAQQAAAHGVKVLADDIGGPLPTKGAWGTFDVVTCLATFEHLPDLSGAFRTCLGLLAPAGVLILEVPLVSDTRDSSGWFQTSYEHVYYPTPRGLSRLLERREGFRFVSLETEFSGSPPTFIAAGTRDPQQWARLQRLFEVMTQPDSTGLDPVDCRLNLAYHVVHCSRPTPERILALPTLLEVASSPMLLKRLTQLWHGDSTRAAQLEAVTAAAAWHEQQARNWRQEYEALAAQGASLAQIERPTGPFLALRRAVRRLLRLEA